MEFAISSVIQVVKEFRDAFEHGHVSGPVNQSEDVISKLKDELDEKEKKIVNLNAKQLEENQKVEKLQKEIESLKKDRKNSIVNDLIKSGDETLTGKEVLLLKLDELENDKEFFKNESEAANETVKIITEDNERLKKELTDAILKGNSDPKAAQIHVDKIIELEKLLAKFTE
uniref:Uncharacterized protein n=1 Tax=Panagrolaimus sp. JU765 TaxID=591449 RepID=A0AC34PY66_9BILA